MLPNGEEISGGGRIIDTPGMRKLTISEMEKKSRLRILKA